MSGLPSGRWASCRHPCLDVAKAGVLLHVAGKTRRAVTYLQAALGFGRYSSPLTNTAHTIGASLLANAQATTFECCRVINCCVHCATTLCYLVAFPGHTAPVTAAAICPTACRSPAACSCHPWSVAAEPGQGRRQNDWPSHSFGHDRHRQPPGLP